MKIELIAAAVVCATKGVIRYQHKLLYSYLVSNSRCWLENACFNFLQFNGNLVKDMVAALEPISELPDWDRGRTVAR